MYLKSLRIQGFKSFPDKTEIRFDGGLTAIVGPNGSGKSNISDAIRWVLGEQSTKSLRGGRMEDVIFGGTARRNPVGFAEVSLILDNTTGVFPLEYGEIMVTRRYYRSGESEYYINKKHVRLRDIHELFMDTGLGRDGYSIIGQGKIDEILSVKSEERREVFEEAAGITKFRYRKEEAERRLRATEENLVRIQDIWKELTLQAEPLEKQAEKAKRYLLLRDELRGLEVSLSMLRLEEIQADVSAAEEKRSQAETERNALAEERDELFSRSDQLLENIRQAELNTESLRGELTGCKQQLSDRQSEGAVLKTKLRNHQENAAALRQETTTQVIREQELDGQIARRETQRLQKEAERRELAEKLSVLDSQIASYTAEKGKKAATRQEIAEKEALGAGEVNRLAAELAGRQAEYASMEGRKSSIDEEIASAKALYAEERTVQASFVKQRQQLDEELRTQENIQRGLAMKQQDRGKKEEELRRQAYQAGVELADCQNRLHMLREMERDYEGFSKSVKLVMQQKDRGMLRGIHGPVSQVISVPSRYVTAVETVLGGALSNIIVDNRERGKDAIAYLKRVDGGRATFLPVDAIQPAVLHEKGLQSEDGFLGIASQVVTCGREYENIVSNLLGRTVITEDLNGAVRLSKKYGGRFRIVTLDGQLMHAGGSMTGGSVRKQTGVLSRANQIRELSETQKTLQNHTADLEVRQETLTRERSDLEFQLESAEERLQKLREDRAACQASSAQHAALLEEKAARVRRLEQEKENLDGAKQQARESIRHAQDKLRAATEARDAFAGDGRAFESALQELDEKMAAASSARQEVQLELSALQSQMEEAQQFSEELLRLRADMTQGIESAEERIAQLGREAEALERAMENNAADARALEQRCGNVEQLIQNAVQHRLALEADRTKTDREAQEKNERILLLEREKASFDNKMIQLKTEEGQILDRLWETYELTPASADKLRQAVEDRPAAQKQAAALKHTMKSLGNINLDAVEEYEKLSERLTFLTAQKDDLETAREDLYQVIGRLAVHMKDTFAQQFETLNGFFDQTFREIFGGGSGELALEDASDILNCGIEIRVSLPGKKLRTISLLSGGEKAFVAIALYFAILKLRPTPFCVLDEIEAALDDVNVVRFAQYLRKLSDKTQFIVITHRRGTMEAADMLYGVTMQEQGVSKLLMINVAEIEQKLHMKLK